MLRLVGGLDQASELVRILLGVLQQELVLGWHIVSGHVWLLPALDRRRVVRRTHGVLLEPDSGKLEHPLERLEELRDETVEEVGGELEEVRLGLVKEPLRGPLDQLPGQRCVEGDLPAVAAPGDVRS